MISRFLFVIYLFFFVIDCFVSNFSHAHFGFVARFITYTSVFLRFLLFITASLFLCPLPIYSNNDIFFFCFSLSKWTLAFVRLFNLYLFVRLLLNVSHRLVLFSPSPTIGNENESLQIVMPFLIVFFVSKHFFLSLCALLVIFFFFFFEKKKKKKIWIKWNKIEMKSYLHHCCSWLFLLCFDVFVCDGCVLIKFVSTNWFLNWNSQCLQK